MLIIYVGDGVTYCLSEAVSEINNIIEDYDEAQQMLWTEIDETDIEEVCQFLHDELEWDEAVIVYQDYVEKISTDTGCFLTKRACQEYIDKYKYNHSNPHTYAMTAYRNYELEHLLRIIKTIDIDKIEIDEV